PSAWRHVNSMLALMSWRRTTTETDAPGAALSARMRRFSNGFVEPSSCCNAIPIVRRSTNTRPGGLRRKRTIEPAQLLLMHVVSFASEQDLQTPVVETPPD